MEDHDTRVALDRHLAGCMECEEFGQETSRVLARTRALLGRSEESRGEEGSAPA